MPQYFLHNHGINVNTDIENHYVGSQESSIMNAFLGQTVAGVTWPPPWRAFQKEHPREAAELKVIWCLTENPCPGKQKKAYKYDSLKEWYSTRTFDSFWPL